MLIANKSVFYLNLRHFYEISRTDAATNQRENFLTLLSCLLENSRKNKNYADVILFWKSANSAGNSLYS